MKKMARIAVLALALAAIMGGMLGSANGAAASTGYEQWMGGFSDGCYYFWDGYSYTSVACPQSDGSYSFYFSGYGEWVYSFSAGYLADGSAWLYYNGQYYFDSPSYGAPTYAVIGGSTWDTITGNPVIDQIVINSNNRMIDTWLEPNCIEIVGNTCYY